MIREIFRIEYNSTKNKPPSNLTAYDYYLQAFPYVWAMQKKSNAKALNCLRRALKLDPKYSPAIALMSLCIAQTVMYAWQPQADRDKCVKSANELADKALEIDPTDPTTLTVHGTAKCLLGDLDGARDSVCKALEINPNDPWSWNRMGWIEGYSCNPDESLACFKKASHISPHDPMLFNIHFGEAQAYFIKKNYQAALESIMKSLSISEDAVFIYRLRAACCFYLNKEREARESVKIILAENDSITSTEIGALVPYEDNEVRRRLVDGLVGAGLKEN